MWKLFFHMFKIIIGNEDHEVDSVDGGYGYEFLPIMLSFFQNCIAYGGDGFFEYKIENDTPFSLLKKAIARILFIDKNSGDPGESSVSSMKLLGTVLENCLGKIDDSLPEVLQILHSELEQSPQKIYKSSILQTFCMCFVYNANLTYACLENLGYTEYLLKSLFSSMNIFTKTYEIRRVLYGIS
mmetsp:Transcript_35269/g.40724  ORF Transcript_35269/g.40724 Transcript_35269/m.40724 type:complete len:184 (-) Transcript_35269:613-1164(-)